MAVDEAEDESYLEVPPRMLCGRCRRGWCRGMLSGEAGLDGPLSDLPSRDSMENPWRFGKVGGAREGVVKEGVVAVMTAAVILGSLGWARPGADV